MQSNNSSLSRNLYIFLFLVVLIPLIIWIKGANDNAIGSSLIQADTEIQQIVIEYNSEKITLTSQNGWKIDDLSANTEIVLALVNLLKSAQITEFSSNNPDNFALYNVDNSSPTLELWPANSATSKKFFLGKSSGGRTYIRFVDSNDVYLINVAINDYGYYTKDKFISLDIFNFDATEILAFTINGKKAIATENNFTVEGSQTSQDIISVVNEMLKFNASRVLTNSEYLEVAKLAPQYTVIFELKDRSLETQIITNQGKYIFLNKTQKVGFEITENLFVLFGTL